MDAAVLLLFAVFFGAVATATWSRYDVLRQAIRRPRTFQLVTIGAAAIVAPVDVYAVAFGTVGPGGAAVEDVTGRLLLLNVAAACGVAALHGCLRGRALAGSGTAAVVAGAASACSPEPSSGSGGQADDGHSIRLGVLGWTGPLIALGVVAAVVVLGSSTGNGTGPAGVGSTATGVGSALAVYSLLVCLISASSLFKRSPARSAIDPREG